MRGLLARLGIALVCAVAGLVVGAASVVLHGIVLGLVLGVVTTTASVVALPAGWHTRLTFALAWMGTVFIASRPRPEGDYLVGADTSGYLLLVVGFAIVLYASLTVRRHRPSGG
ncbi:hypothetical protein [Nocardioides sp. R-C-SC26]|uniref:hypothetical protein n=1 Tax=Nocardioides sp. R-C-SC26 TaxID=2870414 RepID=UPI001E351F75|nr:hypothetical protein [Nocardioides sp. R-C-SC26]